jgi:uncharacterized membrane protein
MIQIQLRPKCSHRHLVPVVVLFFLALAFGNVRGITNQSSWVDAAGGISLGVLMGIGAFYALIPFLLMVTLKENWFGTKILGLSLSRKKMRRFLVVLGVCLTYFGFVCRVWIISGMEAGFIALLVAPAASIHLNPANRPSWLPGMILALAFLIAAAHTLVERRNLGMAGLNISADRTGGWL